MHYCLNIALFLEPRESNSGAKPSILPSAAHAWLSPDSGLARPGRPSQGHWKEDNVRERTAESAGAKNVVPEKRS